MSRTKPWAVSDALWARVRPLIPERPPHLKGGRPAADDRKMFAAIVYLLRTGIPWNAMPHEMGASTTVYDRFRLWEQQGVFVRLWQVSLQEYDELHGLDWQWQSMDGAHVKAPLGGEATGKNSVDRGKRGTKRSQVCEGHGLPLAVVVEGANRNDMIVAQASLKAIVIGRPDPALVEQHLSLDAGYDYPSVLAMAEQMGYVVHVQPNWWNRNHSQPATAEQLAQRLPKPGQKARRWVVERLHAWLNHFRRLLVRWDKYAHCYLTLLCLANALICFQQCDRLCSFPVSE